MKTIIFGAEDKYIRQMVQVMNNCEVVCFLDNDSSKWNKFVNKTKVLPPPMIKFIEYDSILILDNENHKAIREQLMILGAPKEKIWNMALFNADMNKGLFEVKGSNVLENNNHKKKILFIAYFLRYDGSTMAAVNAIEVLKKRGYDVTLASFEGDEKFINDYCAKGNAIIICPSLLYLHNEELTWIKLYDVVIVNTYPMVESACKISRVRPVLWWIHETEHATGSAYVMAFNIYWNYDFNPYFSNISIYAVSNIAKANFEKFYPNAKLNILPYGIQDTYKENNKKIKNSKLVFAIIGNISMRKSQDIFVKAAKQIGDKYKNKAEFWIIGRNDGEWYGNELCKETSGAKNIRICGEMTHDEIERAYQENIDVVVCASWQETMSLVITEAMMYGKPSIMTDSTGMAAWVEDGVNGLICKTGDADDLRDKMEWMLDNRDKLGEMGRNARKTYEEYFTIDKFGERLEEAIIHTMKMYT